MDLEKRYIQLKDFIKEHEAFIQSEILEFYPKLPNTQYIKLLEGYDLKDRDKLIKIENLEIPEGSSSQLSDLLTQIRELSTIEKLETKNISFSKSHLHQISNKKHHEISQIQTMLEKESFKSIFDLCSGKAHLSHLLSLSRKECLYAYDFDKKLQDAGKEIFERYFHDSPNKSLNYTLADLQKPINEIKDNSLLISLHACGDLSSNILKQVRVQDSILSIACCYHKIFHHQNMSQLSKKDKIHLSFHALSLANKSNRVMNEQEWDRRLKVKTFRYIIEMIAKDYNFELPRINQVPFKYYQAPFSKYAQFLSDQELDFDSLFSKYKESEIFKLYIKLEAIRVPMGRTVELFLILDRAIFLKENGHRPQVIEIFDKSISPRNIALFNF